MVSMSHVNCRSNSMYKARHEMTWFCKEQEEATPSLKHFQLSFSETESTCETGQSTIIYKWTKYIYPAFFIYNIKLANIQFAGWPYEI